MNRKLHNSLMALTTSGVMLLVALFASLPATPAAPGDSSSVAQTAAAPHNQTLRGPSRRTLQSVRMPFFSFFLPKE